MPYTKRILCLANSRKESGTCVAGKEIVGNTFGQWIRPVSDGEKEEISYRERRCENGHDPDLLDIIEIQFLEPRPADFQSENHLIDTSFQWRKCGHVGQNEAEAALDSPTGSLWLNGYSSSNGPNDRVPAQEALKLRGSLYLIRPTGLELLVAEEGGFFRRSHLKHRATFSFNDELYKMAVTDPHIENAYSKEGTFKIPECLICVSLGGIYRGHCL